MSSNKRLSEALLVRLTVHFCVQASASVPVLVPMLTPKERAQRNGH